MRITSVPAWLAAVLLVAGATTPYARDVIRKIPGVSGPEASPVEVDPPRPLPPAPPGPAVVSAPRDVVPPTPTAASPGRDGDRIGLSVMVNRAKVIRLPERATTVVVGNPAIADLTLQKNGIVIVTGKSFGVTNLLALDSAGNMLAESLVSVVPQMDGMVVVQRAFERFSYACTPTCQPTVSLGDEKTYFEKVRGQADAHNQFAGSR